MTRLRRVLASGLVLLLAGGLLAGAAWQRLDAWVAATALPPLVPELSVEVLARDGTLLRAYQVGDGRWRLALDPARVDPGYLAMLLAYEDRRFYRHRGVDPLALVRAGAQAVARGRVVSGGSTLTMQVARLIEDGPTGQWAGKWRQIRVALALERRLSKAEILALYLHHAPFGGNIEGLRAASIAWFGKEPARLTPAEAALMVALPQAPEARRPDRHPERASAARDRVLARMVRAGVLDA
ncbi:MAG: transglycosylase domain-containing protein, partial [Rhodobacteraceae bacterium]|nr:transglycosylase domain-containing protein [Paracoccaceae bacterium]